LFVALRPADTATIIQVGAAAVHVCFAKAVARMTRAVQRTAYGSRTAVVIVFALRGGRAATETRIHRWICPAADRPWLAFISGVAAAVRSTRDPIEAAFGPRVLGAEEV